MSLPPPSSLTLVPQQSSGVFADHFTVRALPSHTAGLSPELELAAPGLQLRSGGLLPALHPHPPPPATGGAWSFQLLVAWGCNLRFCWEFSPFPLVLLTGCFLLGCLLQFVLSLDFQYSLSLMAMFSSSPLPLLHLSGLACQELPVFFPRHDHSPVVLKSSFP